jgi:hypothetical protein
MLAKMISQFRGEKKTFPRFWHMIVMCGALVKPPGGISEARLNAAVCSETGARPA